MYLDVSGLLVVVPQLGPYLCDPRSAPPVRSLARRRALVARRRAVWGPSVVRAVILRTVHLRVAPLQVAPLMTMLHHCLAVPPVSVAVVVVPVVGVDRHLGAVDMELQIYTVLEPTYGSVQYGCNPSGSFGIPNGFPACRTIGASLGPAYVSDLSSQPCLHMQGIQDLLVVVE